MYQMSAADTPPPYLMYSLFFFLNDTPTTEIYPLPLHDALPILVWAPPPGTRLTPGQRVALVVYQAPSISRSNGVRALEQAGLPYRVTCTVRGVLGVVAAARAGLGLAIFARSLIPDGLVELPASGGLPGLGEIGLVPVDRA